MVTASDPAAQLVQLGQTEAVGAVDQNGVGIRDVDAGFDDRAAQQQVEALALEVEHDLLQFALGHLAVADADPRFGHQLPEFAGHLLDAGDVVVQEIDLAAAPEFAQAGFPDQRVVPGREEGLDRQSMRRWRGDQAQFAQPGHGHVEGARDRGCGEGQQMDFCAQGLQVLFLAHAEALLFVNDHQAKVAEGDIGLQQAMGADDDIQSAVGELPETVLDLARTAQPRQRFDPDRPIGEAIPEIAVVLLGQQGGRHQHCHLFAGHGGHEGGAHGDLGLAEADIAADQPIHWCLAAEIGDHALDRGQLVRGFLEREARSERFVHGPIDRQGQTLARLSLGLDFQQFGGDVADFLSGLALGLAPGFSTEAVQGRMFGIGAGVTIDQMQLCDRHVKLVAPRVFDFQVLTGLAAGIEHHQATIAADTVRFMDDRRALGDFGEVADDRFGLPTDPSGAPTVAGTFGVQLPLGQQAQRRLDQGEAIFEWGDRDRPARQASGLGGATRQTWAELLPIGDRIGTDAIGVQQFRQCLASAGRIGGQQNPARIGCKKGFQRTGRLALGGQRQSGCGRETERIGFVVARMALAARFDPAQSIQLLAQVVRRQVQRIRCQHRSVDIVPALLVALADLLPDGFGGSQGRLGDHRQSVGIEVVEQADRRRIEEQRQVILDPAGRDTGLEVEVDRTAPRIDRELLAQSFAGSQQGRFVGRELTGRQHRDDRPGAFRALAFGIEAADRLDAVVEQFDPVGRIRAHRKHVEQGAADGEVTGVADLLHQAIAGTVQSAPLLAQIQAIADLPVEGLAGDEGDRWQPLHQGRDRHDQDAVSAGR